MNEISRIPSKLYFDLLTKGNDTPGLTGHKLISVYSILKVSKSSDAKYYAYTSKNNKRISGNALLRAKTNLSLHVINKYIPVLIDMGLCFIDSNGDFVLLGNEKVKELYNSYKLVPIRIGKNLNDTALNVMSVLLHAKNNQQQKQYNKKLTRSEIISQGVNPKTLKQLKDAKCVLKKFGQVVNLNEKTVLSVIGFGVLKHGENSKIKDLKSSGSYWKNKLKKQGLVETKRQFTPLCKMSYNSYLAMKGAGSLSNTNTYYKGHLVEETPSSFKPINLVSTKTVKQVINVINSPVEVYKKKPYLQVDMIDFWINGSK